LPRPDLCIPLRPNSPLLAFGLKSPPTLEAYSTKFTDWDSLVKHAHQIYDSYANASVVEDLRWKRSTQADGMSESDMVFENAVLFLRDTLISREFTDAVKAGDSGRVVWYTKYGL
jgi:hypothetical protein